jgi:Flavodoxin
MGTKKKEVRMRALVVYESMYGNTETVARAVADGLTEAGFETAVAEVGTAPTALREFDLVAAGGPTHAFSMSRASTREDAAAKGYGPIVSTGIGLREWIESLEPADGVAVATFDTRVRHPRVPGSAARAARKHLRQQGFRAVDPATTFWVDGMDGPLLDDEEDRARHWGADLGAGVRTHQATPR